MYAHFFVLFCAFCGHPELHFQFQFTGEALSIVALAAASLFFAAECLSGLPVCPREGIRVEVKCVFCRCGFGPLFGDPLRQFGLRGRVVGAGGQVVPFVGIGLVVVQFLAAVAVADVAVTV